MRRLIPLLAVVLVAGACAEQVRPADEIVVDVGVYLVRPDGAEGTTRTDFAMRALFSEANEIWKPARIRFQPVFVQHLRVSPEAVAATGPARAAFFLQQMLPLLNEPDRPTVVVFALSSVGSGEGVAQAGNAAIAVGDSPVAPPERVLAHELGHVVGLGHVIDLPGRLMLGGDDGTLLVDAEITRARERAALLIDPPPPEDDDPSATVNAPVTVGR